MRVLLLPLLLALLLPRMGAVLGELAGFERVVICRGDALAVVTLRGDGRPVEAELAEAAPCLAAALPGPAPAPQRGWTAAAAPQAPPARTFGAPPPDALWRGPPPLRAPPRRPA